MATPALRTCDDPTVCIEIPSVPVELPPFPLAVKVTASGFGLFVEPLPDRSIPIGPIGPFEVPVPGSDSILVTVCPGECFAPLPVDGSLLGQITVTVTAGEIVMNEVTVPVNVEIDGLNEDL